MRKCRIFNNNTNNKDNAKKQRIGLGFDGVKIFVHHNNGSIREKLI